MLVHGDQARQQRDIAKVENIRPGMGCYLPDSQPADRLGDLRKRPPRPLLTVYWGHWLKSTESA